MSETVNIPTPELDKKLARKDELEHIGQFLEWLQDQGIELCEWKRADAWRSLELMPIRKPINATLAEYAGIDLNAMDAEQRAILEAFRELHSRDGK